MSNPCINRWGMNTFWYNFWYSDTNYAANVRHDALFSKLLNIFLFNGLNIPKNIFSNFYWYAKHYRKLQLPLYYRWTVGKNAYGYKVNYKFRHHHEALFPMRLWLLRYGNWIVINLYWFYPHKGKWKSIRKFAQTHSDAVAGEHTSKVLSLRRMKTLCSLNFFNHIVKKSYYTF
jgi:hypothetical protein